LQSRIEGSTLVTRRSWRAAIYDAWGHCCAYCDAPAQSLDHVIPRSQGGPTTQSNLVACCLACNRRKGDQGAVAWWRQQPSWSPDREQRLLDWITPG
jgi:5-methylcytosine-specific restriction endonuclease McrA